MFHHPGHDGPHCFMALDQQRGEWVHRCQSRQEHVFYSIASAAHRRSERSKLWRGCIFGVSVDAGGGKERLVEATGRSLEKMMTAEQAWIEVCIIKVGVASILSRVDERIRVQVGVNLTSLICVCLPSYVFILRTIIS